MYKIILHIMILMVPLSAYTQEGNEVLKGIVVNAKSMEPIPWVSLKSSLQLTLSNQDGFFEIRVKKADLVALSHVGFQPRTWLVGDTLSKPVEIFLEENVVELGEVEVNAFLSEEQFKGEVIQSLPKYHYQNNLAARNLQLIKKVFHWGYFYDYASYNTFFKHSKSVSEVSFLSSNPSVGLFKAFRQAGSRRNFSSAYFPNFVPHRPALRKRNQITAP